MTPAAEKAFMGGGGGFEASSSASSAAIAGQGAMHFAPSGRDKTALAVIGIASVVFIILLTRKR